MNSTQNRGRFGASAAGGRPDAVNVSRRTGNTYRHHQQKAKTMSQWDNFTGGQEANDRTQRKIDDWFAYKRRQTLHYVAIALVAGALILTLVAM
jgi:hypothetical protein